MHAPGVEVRQHGLVVNEVSENGERFSFTQAIRKRDGIANSEAHPEMGGAKDSHGRSGGGVGWWSGGFMG
jgi:hypothetical protein